MKGSSGLHCVVESTHPGCIMSRTSASVPRADAITSSARTPSPDFSGVSVGVKWYRIRKVEAAGRSQVCCSIVVM